MSHTNIKAFDSAVEITNTFVSTLEGPDPQSAGKYADEISSFFETVFNKLVTAEDEAWCYKSNN